MQSGSIPTDQVVSLDQARKIVAAHLRLPVTRDAALPECCGLFASRGVSTDCALPRDTTSRRDGYAIRSSDTAGATSQCPVQLRVCPQVVTAGALITAPPAGDALNEGEAIRIMTGALLPQGADAVLAFEETDETEASQITIRRAVRSGNQTRTAGSEIPAGEMVVKRGERIGPGVCGLAAALGLATLPVYLLPRALVVAIGDEILSPGASPAPGKLHNDGATILAELLKELGFEATISSPIPDDPEVIVQTLQRAAAERYDLVLTTGGTGGGDHDFIRDALCAVVGKPLFSGLGLRPGGGTMFAVIRDTVCFALPGTPGAATMVFELLVRPAARALCGSANPGNPTVAAVLGEPLWCKSDQVVRPYRMRLSVSVAGVQALPVARTYLYRELRESNGIWISRPGCDVPQPGDSLTVEATGSIYVEDQ